MANKFFWEYGATDNSEDEDLQSQLYAEIYYAPSEETGRPRTEIDGRSRVPLIEGREEAEKKYHQCQKGQGEEKGSLSGSIDTVSKGKVPKQNDSESLQSKSGRADLASEDTKPDVTLLDTGSVDEKPVVKCEDAAGGSISEEKDEKSSVLKEFTSEDVKPPENLSIEKSLINEQNSAKLQKAVSVNDATSVKSEVEAYDEAETVETKNVELMTNAKNVSADTETASAQIKVDRDELERENTESQVGTVTAVDNTRNEEEATNVLKKYEFSKKFINELYEQKFKQLEQVLLEEEERQNLKELNQQDNCLSENEMDTRYAIMQKHEKKKQTPPKHNEGQMEESGNESDSEESILEVPIPPKPQPPIINLQDSDEDIIISSDSDTSIECTVLSKKRSKGKNKKTVSTKSPQSQLHGKEKVSGSSKRKKSYLEFDYSSDVSSGSIDDIKITNMEEDIILHCTEAQRGASSIKEIKEKSKGDKKLTNTSKPEINKGLNDKDHSSKEKLSPKQPLKTVPLATSSKTTVSPKSNKNMDKAEAKSTLSLTTDDGAHQNKSRQCQNIEDRPSTSKQVNCTINSEQGESSENNVENRDNRKRKREETWEEYIFRPMSEKLKAFYNESRGQENYDIAEIQKNMSKDPNMWAILDEDLRPSCNKRQRFWNVRCSNCHREGHQRYNCDEPRRPARCHMCGVQGHTEMRCPQKICLTCGKKQGSFRKTCESCRILYCHMCDSIGHKSTECPDLWRRFHQTTRMTNINIPDNLNEVMKPADLLVCCNCAKRGHDSSTCNEYRWSQHFPTPAYVSSYTDGPGYTSTTPRSNQSQSSHSQQTPNSLPPLMPPKFHEASQSQQSSTKKKRSKASQDEDIIPVRTTEDPFSSIGGQEYQTIYTYGKYNGRHPAVRYAKRFTHENVKTAGFLNGKVAPSFLKELMQHLHMGFEVGFHYRPDNRLLMDIKSYSSAFGKLVHQLTFHWMQLSDDEKPHAMMIQLPVNRERMIDFLNAKVPELKIKYDEDLLWPRVKMLKEQMVLNKDPALRIGIMKELIDSQSKLVKMVQTKPRITNGVNRIKKFVNELTCSNAPKVDPRTFVSILVFFNKLFTSYTPPDRSYVAKMRSDAYKAMREAKNNRNQEDTASVGINAQQTVVNQGGSGTENIDTYRTETVQFSQNNEARNSDDTIQFSNIIPGFTISAPNNLYTQNQDPSLPNKPQIPPLMQYPRFNARNHEIVDFTNDNCTPLMSVQNINNAPSELPESSSNQYPTITFNDKVEAIQINEPCAPRNKKKSEKNKKAKKDKKANKSLLKKFMQFGQRKSNVRKNLMERAHKALANAVAFELPYMTKEAAQVAKRMSNNTLKPKHVDVLQRLVNLEKSHQKQVNSVPRIPG